MQQQTETSSAAAASTHQTEVAEIAAEAYLFGYPLVLMDATRRLATATAKAVVSRAPANQFAHMRSFPDASFTDVVSPNADTLYSVAWLDLAREPIVLSVPDVGNRYYLMPMLDAWTNVFANPGSRTTGTKAGHFVVVGPHWSGSLPAGLTTIKAPTNMVWLIGRTQTNGKEDFAAVRAIQDKYTLTPLSAWARGEDYRPPTNVALDQTTDTKTPPPIQLSRMSAAEFYGRLNALMVGNPPNAADAAVVARLASIGIAPGRPIDARGLPVAYEAGLKAAHAKLIAAAKAPQGTSVNGWDILPNTVGRFGNDYEWRAIVALIGLGANLPEDAVYPHATTDSQGRPLTGDAKYVIRFPKDELPPVNAFWSVTMYNAKQGFVDNPINRFAIGDRDKLARDPDGSLTLQIQHDSPGKERESNWLPAPTGPFNLFLRLYAPSKPVLDGTWRPPGVERIS